MRTCNGAGDYSLTALPEQISSKGMLCVLAWCDLPAASTFDCHVCLGTVAAFSLDTLDWCCLPQLLRWNVPKHVFAGARGRRPPVILYLAPGVQTRFLTLPVVLWWMKPHNTPCIQHASFVQGDGPPWFCNTYLLSEMNVTPLTQPYMQNLCPTMGPQGLSWRRFKMYGHAFEFA